MARWFIGVVVVIFVCFAGGWALVWVSGYGGNRGGSSLVWSIGGIMVYSSLILAPFCFLAGLIALVVQQVVHGSQGRGER